MLRGIFMRPSAAMQSSVAFTAASKLPYKAVFYEMYLSSPKVANIAPHNLMSQRCVFQCGAVAPAQGHEYSTGEWERHSAASASAPAVATDRGGSSGGDGGSGGGGGGNNGSESGEGPRGLRVQRARRYLSGSGCQNGS